VHLPIRNQRAGNHWIGWAAVVDRDKVRPVGACRMSNLHLGRHRRGMGFAQRRQFGRPRTHLDSTRAVIGYAHIIIDNDCAVVNVMDNGDVDVVDGAVVVEVA
jgi:hypothetical protein